MTPAEAFPTDPFLVAKIKVDPFGCWLYQGAISSTGYGKLGRHRSGARRVWLAHRYAYTLAVGVIPEGLTLDHICRVRHCVNPQHLRPLTIQENLVAPGSQTTTALYAEVCPQGHEKTPENTALHAKGARASRSCRICVNAKRREKRARRRASAC